MQYLKQRKCKHPESTECDKFFLKTISHTIGRQRIETHSSQKRKYKWSKNISQDSQSHKKKYTKKKREMKPNNDVEQLHTHEMSKKCTV